MVITTYRFSFLAAILVSMTLAQAKFSIAIADNPLDIWPDLAPGETSHHAGDVLPFRDNEVPPVTRVVNITRPTMTVHPAVQPCGTSVVILPGGGFSKVVPDKEGTEAAQWLNQLGVTAFVLSYRTTEGGDGAGWQKPLQDAQRAMSLVRSQAERWQINPERVGLVGFSAGGQVAARLLSGSGGPAYDRGDAIDDVSYRPDFAMLVYPWNLYDTNPQRLVDGVEVTAQYPPTFLVHTDDDRSSSLGTVLLYAGLKSRGIASELHIFGNGGHGYGLRPVEGSQISSWTDHAAHWLGTHGLISERRMGPTGTVN